MMLKRYLNQIDRENKGFSKFNFMLISTFFNFIIDISSCEDPSDFLLGLLELEEVIIGRRLHNLIVFKSFAS